MLALTPIRFYFNTYFGIAEVSLQYVYSCIHFGDQCGDFQHRPSDLKISRLLEILQMFHIHMHLSKIIVSPTGVVTALAVAVGLLAVALLFSIGVAIHRRRAHYSREV